LIRPTQNVRISHQVGGFVSNPKKAALALVKIFFRSTSLASRNTRGIFMCFYSRITASCVALLRMCALLFKGCIGQPNVNQENNNRPGDNRMSRQEQIAALEKDWSNNPRWSNVKRGYTAEDVVRLRGSIQPEYTLARRGAEKLWELVNGSAKKGYVNCLGALTGGQAMQQAKAGIEAIYLSGWQVAADANTSETMYPDQSLYAYDSVPTVVRRINNCFKRADEIQWSRGVEPGDEGYIDYFLPIVADAEAGFGGVLNAFELMKSAVIWGVKSLCRRRRQFKS
jgi:hypothetical protein